MRKHVLVVDDDQSIREAVTAVLTHEGYLVAAVENGKDALSYLRSTKTPHLVLLDLTMPILSGFEVLEQHRVDSTLHIHTIVVVSALVNHYLERLKDTKAVAFLSKPVELAELLQVVKEWSRS